MNRKVAVLVLILGVMHLALGVAAHAQQQAKVAKIGWLRARPGASPRGASEGIRRMLRELGYVEGKNIVFEYRYTEGELDRIPALADELVRLKVDVLVASSTAEVLAFKNATKTLPIVFYLSSDPVADGLVDSLPRPGSNITGFTTISPVLSGKRLELLRETVSKLSRVALLWDPQNPSSMQQWKESQLPARELGLQLHSLQVSSADKFEGAFKEATKARSAALAVTESSLTNSYQKWIADLATKNRLPAIYPREDFVNSGGMMSYGPDLAEPYKRVAVFVDKILKGTKPADLPIEQPKKFEFIVNLKAAKQIGLTIPPNVLVRADKVIR